MALHNVIVTLKNANLSAPLNSNNIRLIQIVVVELEVCPLDRLIIRAKLHRSIIPIPTPSFSATIPLKLSSYPSHHLINLSSSSLDAQSHSSQIRQEGVIMQGE